MPDLIVKHRTQPANVSLYSTNPLRYDVNGAVITEALDSDAGNLIALDRKEVVKRWIVRCPYLDDKPTVYLAVVFPQGQVYQNPLQRAINRNSLYDGLVVYGYDEGERIGIKEWHSVVIYRSADELATLGWVGEGEYSEEQEHVARDIDGELIGHASYKEMPEDTATTNYDAQAASANGTTLKLKSTGAFKVVGIDRYRSIHRFSMTRVLTALNWRQVRTVGSMVWTVNDSKFLDYKVGELAFSNFGWREVFGAIPNAPSTNKQYEVRLQFSANIERWSPVKLYETFTDEHGFESPVYKVVGGAAESEPLSIERKPYRATSFSTIFNTLNTTAPA